MNTHAEPWIRPREPQGREGWLASLRNLLLIPEDLRDESIPRAVALELLQCGPEILDELLAEGLPHGGEKGDERFERYDLVNLALYSGSGESVPEKTMAYALRWMHADPATLFRPRRWDYSVVLSPPAADDGADPAGMAWNLATPRPELHGGWTESLTIGPEAAVLGDKDITVGGTTGLTASGVLVTSGERREIRSPRLREIVTSFGPDRYRWGRMPEEFQWRGGEVLAQGYAPCIAVCLELAERCRAAGFEARTRRGWIMGMLDLAHSWLEVVDEDGVVKTVDPAFVILAAHHAEAAHPAAADAFTGSLLNRLMPTEHHADEPVNGYRRDGRFAHPRHQTDIQLSAEQPAPHETDGAARGSDND
ncbi:hypothetical protein [Streptomyces sp. SID8352]|uniref:hypothetical protein n=1 Tax=Streptomyces sp. SID8352 TaxID=2690338 RepID=UPI00136983AE|nr:hypothetical protein [Streptomyces sp. SID8352]MYU25781.1 hypothetical protein [Streptomyces sp. SID8352]